MESLFSLIAGFFILFTSLLVITSRNPVYSVFFLILVFLISGSLLISFQVDFIALLFIIVYIGAIAILFLFVVMMLNIKLFEEKISRYLPIGSLVGFVLFLELSVILYQKTSLPIQTLEWENQFNSLSNIQVFGHLLYTEYFYFFIISSIILLLAMIGAITLTLHQKTIKQI